MMEVVVQECRSEVVSGTDRVDVAGQVEVEVLHRNDLRVAAAGGAALDAENRTERRLTDRDSCPMTDPTQALGQPDRGRGLSFAQRRGRDRGDDDIPSAWVGRL
jgi:hypothetical protein